MKVVKMKKFLLKVISISLLLSATAYAEECAVYFKNDNVIIIKDSTTNRALLGAAIGGGALGYLLTDLVVKAGDEKIPAPSKNPKHLKLANFLSEKTNSAPPLDLNNLNVKNLPAGNLEDKCAVKVTSVYNVMDNYDNSNVQMFKIQRMVDGVSVFEKFVRVSSNMDISLFQHKPKKILKEDAKTGKYIDVSKKMIDEKLYTEMVFDEFVLSNRKNIAKVIEKYKDLVSK
jgi:hypothetical protein